MELTNEMRTWIESVVPDASDVEVIRPRPWAVVAKIHTASAPLWFKANHATFAYEAALIERLGELMPERVLAPVVRNEQTGWFVAEDGGGLATVADAAEVAEVYREVQRAAAPHVDALLACGVPDMRPSALGAVLDRAAADPDIAGLVPDLERVRPQFDKVCERLAADLASSGSATIVNTDMKLEHAFAGPPVRLFDWGDAVVTHPLLGLASLRHNMARIGMTIDADPHALEADAARIAPLLAAAVWMRDPPGMRERHPDRIRPLLAEIVANLTAGRTD